MDQVIEKPDQEDEDIEEMKPKRNSYSGESDGFATPIPDAGDK